MRSKIIILVLVLYSYSCFSQIPSGNNTLHDDSTSVNKLFKIYNQYISTNFDSALAYSSKALKISQKIKDNYLISKSYLYLGNTYINMGEFKFALQNFENAELYAKKNDTKKSKELSIIILDRIAWVFYKMSNYKYAIEYAKKSLNIDSLSNASAYNTLAAIHLRQADYLSAMNYYIKSEKIYNLQNDLAGLTSIYSNLATIYLYQKDFKRALKYLFKAVTIANDIENNQITTINLYSNIGAVYYEKNMSDSAEFYYKKALSKYQKIQYIDGVIIELLNLAEIKIDKKEYLETLNYLEEAKQNINKINDINKLIELYFSFARLNYEQNQLDSSLHYLFEAYDTAKKYNHHEQAIFALKHISIVYVAKEDYKKAYLYYDKFFLLNDSVFDINKTEIIEQLKFSFETEKNLTEIENLNKEKNYQSIIITNQKKILFIILFSLILIIIFTVFISRQLVNKNNAYKQLVEKNEILLNIDEELNIQLESKLSNEKKGISDEKKIELLENLKKTMLSQKPFLKSTFSLDQLSKELNTNRSYLSKVINESFNMNFPNFVNEYRIKEACRLISAKKHESETIQSIAEDVGFNSPSAFNNAFKKFTGVTPSFYIKEIKKNEV